MKPILQGLPRTLLAVLFAATSAVTVAVAGVPPSAVVDASPSPLLRPAADAGDLHIIAYHDVVVDDTERRALRDRQAITVATLVRHFAWLRDNGYRVVGVQQLLDARSGGAALPSRAVLLSFDDAYRSFHTHVLPLLELYDYQATLAIVGRWIETGDGERIGDEALQRERLLSWSELRDVVASGRVEIASHSWDLHHGHAANPQGNTQPAATARQFDTASGQYESVAALQARVERDLRRNSELLARQLGVQARVMVWPYGASTPPLQQLAQKLGMPAGFTLEDGVNTAATPLSALRRVLVQSDTDAVDLERALRPQRARAERSLEVSLDAVYDPDPVAQEQKLSRLLDELQRLAPSSIYLRAVSAVRDASGRVTTYFPNRQLPLRADLFNRVAWQVRTRLGITVLAWLPVADAGPETVATLYRELAQAAPFAGIYFDETAERDDERIVALVAVLRAEMTRLRVARRVAPDWLEAMCDETRRGPALRRLQSVDWIVVSPMALDHGARGCGDPPRTAESEGWQLPPAAVGNRRLAAARLAQWAQLGVPVERLLWRADDASGASLARLRALHAAGVRHMGYGDRLAPGAGASDALRLLLSTEGTPIAR